MNTERRTPWQLAELARCADPDTLTSPGAALLRSIESDVYEMLADEPRDDVEAYYYDGRANEIADQAPSVYNATRWSEFADLAAWQEEPESGAWPDDLTEAAGIALYQIADRLVRALLAEYFEEKDNQ